MSKLNLRACSTGGDCGTDRYRNQWGKCRRGWTFYREHVSLGTSKEARDRSIKKPEREWRPRKHVGEVGHTWGKTGDLWGSSYQWLQRDDFPSSSEGKASTCNAEDLGSIPGSGRSSGDGNGNPLQYSCLENPMDRGAWWATVHGVAESQTSLSDQHTHTGMK